MIVNTSLRRCKYFETRPFKCLAVLQFHVSRTKTSTASALVEILVVSLMFVFGGSKKDGLIFFHHSIDVTNVLRGSKI